MSIAAHFDADRRGALLQILSAAGAPVNPVMLRAALEEATLHRPSLDQVRADLAWLSQHGAVVLEGGPAEIQTATLTERGEDLARGRTQILGVSIYEEA